MSFFFNSLYAPLNNFLITKLVDGYFTNQLIMINLIHCFTLTANQSETASINLYICWGLLGNITYKLLCVVGTSSPEGREEQAWGGHHHQKQAGPPHDSRGHGCEADGRRVPLCPLQRKRWVKTSEMRWAQRLGAGRVRLRLWHLCLVSVFEILISSHVWRRLSVDNLLKYTGYGNAAGLLVARGLLAGGRGETEYSEDEDSDTDEYKSAKPLWVSQAPSLGLLHTEKVVCRCRLGLLMFIFPALTPLLVMWRSRCRTPLRRWRRSRRSMKLKNWPICLTSCQGETLKESGDLALLKTLFKKQERFSFKDMTDDWWRYVQSP